jgi:ligand-binding sensor domain-containing protein
MIRALCAALLLALAAPACAQHGTVVRVRHFEPENGLSNRHARALLQDHLGFIWVGTVSGLDRFDGHSFRNWSVSHGLSSSWVDALRLDAEGAIWVFATDAADDIITIDILGKERGTLKPLQEHFTQFPIDPAYLVRVGPRRPDGGIVLGARTPARCVRYRKGGTFQVIELPGERFEPLGDDRLGGIIGLLIAKDSSRAIVRVDTLGDYRVVQQLEPGADVESLVSGRTTTGALYRIRTADGRLRYFDTYSEMVLTPTQGNARRVAHTDPIRKALNITPLPSHQLDLVDTRIIDANDSVLFDLSVANPEVGGRVKDCLLDASGEPWLATEFGLFRIEVRGDAFQRWLYQPQIPEGTGVLCRGMAVQGNTLHLSTEWDGSFRIQFDGEAPVIEKQPSPQFLFGMHVGANGTCWRGGVKTVVSTDAAGVRLAYAVEDNIWSIVDGLNSRLILGGLRGLWHLDPVSGSVRAWNDPTHPELAAAHVLQLRLTTNGDVLATTSKGLYRIGGDGRVRERYWTGAKENLRIPYDDLHHVLEDGDGVFWLSTRGAGLVRFESGTGRSQQFNTRNGFPNNMVYAAYEDRQGQLWLPTDGGLVRFDKETRQSTVFTTADGIAHDEFNRLAHAQAADGRLFFGGLNGVTAFDPAHFERNSDDVQHPLVFTSFMHYSPEQGDFVDFADEVPSGQPLELASTDRSIRVSFALLSYEPLGRVVYAWRLAGVQDEWTYQSEPFVRLDRLPYGNCTLEVKARDGTGRWNSAVLQLPLVVRMPWQEHRAAWAGFGALALALTLSGARTLRRPRKRA